VVQSNESTLSALFGTAKDATKISDTGMHFAGSIDEFVDIRLSPSRMLVIVVQAA